MQPTLKPPTRKPTLTRAAQELCVTRTHLSLVLHGHRESKRLKVRYAAWLKQQEAQP